MVAGGDQEIAVPRSRSSLSLQGWQRAVQKCGCARGRSYAPLSWRWPDCHKKPRVCASCSQPCRVSAIVCERVQRGPNQQLRPAPVLETSVGQRGLHLRTARSESSPRRFAATRRHCRRHVQRPGETRHGPEGGQALEASSAPPASRAAGRSCPRRRRWRCCSSAAAATSRSLAPATAPAAPTPQRSPPAWRCGSRSP